MGVIVARWWGGVVRSRGKAARGWVGYDGIKKESVKMFGFIVAGIFFLFADIVWRGNLRRGKRIGMVSRSRTLIDDMKEKWHSVVDMYRIS